MKVGTTFFECKKVNCADSPNRPKFLAGSAVGRPTTTLRCIKFHELCPRVMRGDVETYKFNEFILSWGESVKSASIGELLKKVFGTQFVHQPAPEAFAKLRKVPLRSAQVNSIWGANKRQFAIALMVSLSLSTALSHRSMIQIRSAQAVQCKANATTNPLSQCWFGSDVAEIASSMVAV